MTDVPEHLLARSKERRAALGLGGEGGDAPAAAPTAGAPAASGAAPTAAPVPAAAAAPVVVEPPRPDPPYVAAAKARPRVPVFVAPVLAALPVFAFVYWGALSPREAPADPQLALGAEVYANRCPSCHQPDGSGNVGRPLGEVVTVFPDAADHVAWVENGNEALAPGTPYGVGRQAKQDGYETMPGFADDLTAEEIAAVVRYEREEFGGEAPPAGVAGVAEGDEAEGTDEH